MTEHNGTNYRIRMMSWDTIKTQTMAVVSTKAAAIQLANKYSQQYPNCHIDFVSCL